VKRESTYLTYLKRKYKDIYTYIITNEKVSPLFIKFLASYPFVFLGSKKYHFRKYKLLFCLSFLLYLLQNDTKINKQSFRKYYLLFKNEMNKKNTKPAPRISIVRKIIKQILLSYKLGYVLPNGTIVFDNDTSRAMQIIKEIFDMWKRSYQPRFIRALALTVIEFIANKRKKPFKTIFLKYYHIRQWDLRKALKAVKLKIKRNKLSDNEVIERIETILTHYEKLAQIRRSLSSGNGTTNRLRRMFYKQQIKKIILVLKALNKL